jgi:hypothetical protein
MQRRTRMNSFVNVGTMVTPAAVAVALIGFSAEAEDPKACTGANLRI